VLIGSEKDREATFSLSAGVLTEAGIGIELPAFSVGSLLMGGRLAFEGKAPLLSCGCDDAATETTFAWVVPLRATDSAPAVADAPLEGPRMVW